jgi:group II intron reverse transcriptase/maturase
MLLQAIYEGSFSGNSHGFRPSRSCQTALEQVQTYFNGTRWFVEGDIEGFFDNIDHHKLISLLKQRIKDERFINLIWKFIRAGYLEDWKYNKTYSGAPQGGIFSPILANIYLNELDRFMEEYIQTFNRGSKRRLNPSYMRISNKIDYREKCLKVKQLEKEQRSNVLQEIKELRRERDFLSSTDPNDQGFRRLYYVRYADDFLIGIIGSKSEAGNVKETLTTFLRNELNLRLSEEKTLITHSSKPARFLGYDVVISRNKSARKCRDGITRKTNSYSCKLFVPKESWIGKLKDLGILKIKPDGTWTQIHRTSLKDLDDLEILNIYNSQIRGMYNYYKIANNVSVLNKFYHHMKYSMYKTIAGKYKSSISKILRKYNCNGVFTVTFETNKGVQQRTLYSQGFKRQKYGRSDPEIDILPNEQENKGRTSLVERLKAKECEWCRETGVPLEIHHVRKLKDLKGRKKWEQDMIGRRRKTMALCIPCHQDLHSGKLD